MARKRRVIYPDHCYHVMMRGVGGCNIFDDDFDRCRFCLLLQYASETSKFSIHGFCLMNNHVHLLIQPQTFDLSTGMHRLGFRYAQYYNKKTERQGYLFQGRYRAIVVQNGVYLRRLSRYIHRNPVRANLVKNPFTYPWSSYHAYLGYSEFTWLKTDLVMSLFGSEHQEALESFQKYTCLDDQDAKNELQEIRKSTGIGAYGNNGFLQEYRDALDLDCKSIGVDKVSIDKLSYAMVNQSKINLEKLLNVLSSIENVYLKELQSPIKTVFLTEARAAFVCLALKLRLSSTGELARLLNRDVTSIVRLQKRAEKIPRFTQLSEKILTSL